MRITRMRNKSYIYAAVLALTTLAGAAGCNHDKESGKVRASTTADPLKIKVSSGLLREITVGKPEWREVTTEQKVAARVETDASHVARIGSPVDGRITKMLVYEGQKVSRGQ